MSDSIPPPSRGDLRDLADAAHHLARTAREVMADGRDVAPRLPLLPRIILPADDDPPTSDPRHRSVSVHTVPVRGQAGEVHAYRDDGGMSWQTYGQEHDFSTERMLEIHNGYGDIVATYPPGSWLYVRHGDYLDSTGGQP